MFLSKVDYRCAAVMICGIFLTINTVAADGTEESVVAEQTVKSEINRVAEVQLSKHQVEQQKLRELMNFTLVGTVLSDAGKSIAIIEENRTNEQKFYRMGDLVRGGRITKILKDRIVLTKNGIDIELRLNGGTSRGTGTTMIPESSGDLETGQDSTMSAETIVEGSHFPKIERKALEELSQLPKFSLPVTQQQNGGFHIDSAEKDGPLWKLGLKPGDVIVSFNARVPDVGSSFSNAVAQALSQNEGVLRLEVENDGKPDVLYLEIDD